MASSMPVPIEFELPDGWEPTRPETVGAPEAAFVALHVPSEGPGFTTNITVDGERRSDAAGLHEIAEESVRRLHQVSQSVFVSRRSDFGSSDAPGLNQLLHVSTVVEGQARKLVQSQVYLLMPDVFDPRERAIVRLVLTVDGKLYDSVVGDFQKFIGSVRIKNPE